MRSTPAIFFVNFSIAGELLPFLTTFNFLAVLIRVLMTDVFCMVYHYRGTTFTCQIVETFVSLNLEHEFVNGYVVRMPAGFVMLL